MVLPYETVYGASQRPFDMTKDVRYKHQKIHGKQLEKASRKDIESVTDFHESTGHSITLKKLLMYSDKLNPKDLLSANVALLTPREQRKDYSVATGSLSNRQRVLSSVMPEKLSSDNYH